MDKETGKLEETGEPVDSRAASSRNCPACGARARRASARFCSACGRSLDEAYLPADALRASYNLKHRRMASGGGGGGGVAKPPKSSMKSVLPATNNNGASTTALAFVTYGLVPYLGILFCPGALLMGSVGLYRSYSVPERGGRRASYFAVGFGLLILIAQILLWWILYKIPQWATQI
jgi:hypothetical protein